MAIDAEGKVRRTANSLLLALLGIFGIGLMWLGHVYPFLSLAGEIGIAFLVASVLGFLVDRSLKQELIRDAVSASLGYLLPEQLKPELGWLYDQKLIAEQTYHVRLEHIPEKRTVVLHGIIARRLENISGEIVMKNIGGGIDEWFHNDGESEITACEYRRIKKNERESDRIAIQPYKTMFGVGYTLGEIAIASEECIELLMSYKQLLPDHGMETLSYRFLIDRPQVILDVPPSLKAFVTFSHRDKYDKESDLQASSTRLEGMLLPHQEIRVYWHRADEATARAEKYKIKVG